MNPPIKGTLNLQRSGKVGDLGNGGGILNINKTAVADARESSSSSRSSDSGGTTRSGTRSLSESSDADVANAEAAFETATEGDGILVTDDGSNDGRQRDELEREALESLADKNNPLNAEFVETRTKLQRLGEIADELTLLGEELFNGAERALIGEDIDSFAQTVSRFNEVLSEASNLSGQDFSDLELTEVTDQASAEQAAGEVLNRQQSERGLSRVDLAQERVDFAINLQQVQFDGIVNLEVRNLQIQKAEQGVGANQGGGAADVAQASSAGGTPTVQELLNPQGQGLQSGVLGNLLAGNKLSAFDENVRRQIDGLAQVRNSLKTKV